jgi:eukaryotic translation initiation factor 2-alpha kinase 4
MIQSSCFSRWTIDVFSCMLIVQLLETPSKAIAKLKTLFEGTDYFQKAAPTIAHLKEVYEYSKRMSIATKLYIMPLLSLNESAFSGGMLFSCLYDKKVKDVFAAGGRYDGLIRQYRPRIGGHVEDRHAVGFALSWERWLIPRATNNSKQFLKKADEEAGGILDAKRVRPPQSSPTL